MKKRFHIKSLFLVSLFTSIWIGSIASADIPRDCLWALNANSDALPLEKNVETPKTVLEEVKSLVIDAGFEVKNFASLTEIVAQIADQIQKSDYTETEIGASSIDEYFASLGADDLSGNDQSLLSIFRADQFGEFAMTLLEVVSSELSERENLSLQNQLAVLVHKLERWEQKDWKKSNVFMESYGGILIHFEDFPEMVKSYVDRTENYNQIEGDSGIISRDGMRQIVSHNHWPVDLLPHDMKHVHYAFGHPVAISNVFRASRSRNNLRYVVTSALYEAVDTVQYHEETAIIKYYSKKRSATIELGLVYSGWVPTRELIRLAEESGTKSDFLNLASKFSDWVPSYSSDWDRVGRSSKDFEADVLKMIESFFGHSKDALWFPYTNYQINPQIGGSDIDDAEKHY